jgi:hypothetical protein
MHTSEYVYPSHWLFGVIFEKATIGKFIWKKMLLLTN